MKGNFVSPKRLSLPVHRREMTQVAGAARNVSCFEGGEQFIAQDAGGAQITGAEIFADAARGVVGQVQRVMQPPSAVVVPQMVVQVSLDYSDRKAGIVPGHCINTEQSPASRVPEEEVK